MLWARILHSEIVKRRWESQRGMGEPFGCNIKDTYFLARYQ